MQENQRQVNRIALLFTLIYMVSYMTRINYGAIISEMVSATGYSRTMLSMALTGSFVTYGIGQIVSGICGDYFSPKKLITLGFGLSVLMNLLIPFCPSPYFMLAVWCVNGFAQAFLWPPLVRLMTVLLSEENYRRVSVKVSWGSSFGTIAVYLLSPLLISLAGWKSVFFFSALCGGAMILIWNLFGVDTEISSKKKVKTATPVKSDKGTPSFVLLLFGILLGIILQGLLRDGVTTWMPSYISETYHLGNAVSILTGVVLPIFGILCFQLASIVHRKLLKNPLTCAALFFGVGALCSMVLHGVSGETAVLSVLFSAMLTGCMHGVNLILICMIPPYFKNSGKVSTVSGLLNACTYVGSALSTYGTALLSERFGWNFTLLLWLSVAVLGTLICLLCAAPFKRRFLSQK